MVANGVESSVPFWMTRIVPASSTTYWSAGFDGSWTKATGLETPDT